MHTILVVDDSKNIREFCGRELEKCGYRVLVAAGGREPLNLCDTEFPDVVVLDVRMPGLDGFETIRRLVYRSAALPVIFHTAHREDVRPEELCVPARWCVEKSQDLGELKSAISEALTWMDRERKAP